MTDTKFIMVVEDDPILKNLLGHTFAGKYQTLYASDGNEALTLFEQYKPSLVLLDLMLPTMGGYEVLQAIRARTDEHKDVPVVIVSNLGQATDVEKAKSLGANDYLVKAEVEIEEIVRKIEGMLSAPAPETPQAPAA
ncbi:MAG TPA: response regulator [Candidatus Paceibacterota bacterium]|nr:response regulator [Candidatus Paceibacterota bacterium]